MLLVYIFTIPVLSSGYFTVYQYKKKIFTLKRMLCNGSRNLIPWINNLLFYVYFVIAWMTAEILLESDSPIVYSLLYSADFLTVWLMTWHWLIVEYPQQNATSLGIYTVCYGLCDKFVGHWE